MKEPASMLESTSKEISKNEVFQSMGLPWDVLFEEKSGTTGWLYLYAEKVVSNPLTYVPYLGLIAGGGDVTVFTRFYCFGRNDALFGTAMSEENMYKTIFSEYAAIFDDDAANEREARLKSELKESGLAFDSEQLLHFEWVHWLRESQIPDFKQRLFDECRENGLRELNEFKEFL